MSSAASQAGHVSQYACVGIILLRTRNNMVLMSEKARRPFNVPLDSKEGNFIFVAVVVMLYTVALFISVGLHEVVGHGLSTIAVGGDFYAVYMSPGSGYALLFVPEGTDAGARAFIFMAGILVELVAGCILFFLILPRLKRFMTRLFGLILSVALLVHPSIYLFLGFYYEDGDTYKAARTLGMMNNADAFVVTGLILSGLFVILISMAALNFLSKYLDGAETEGSRLLLLFWLPLIILGGTSAFVSTLFLSGTDMTYALANACILLLLIGSGILVVPALVESTAEPKPHKFSGKSLLAVFICFMLALSLWVGVFGPTDTTARGIMLHNPPLEAEAYYSDYTIGNADLMVYANGTVGISIGLRNLLDNSSSPLDEKLYHSFDERPNWPYYVERARYMVLVMFGLSTEEAQNLTFGTSTGTVRALGVDYENGRICTTYLEFEFAESGVLGVRQIDTQTTAGGLNPPSEALSFGIIDPWVLQGGYLDEMRISWEGNLTLSYYSASNIQETHILFNRGSMAEYSIGWKNVDYESSPSKYSFTIRRYLET